MLKTFKIKQIQSTNYVLKVYLTTQQITNNQKYTLKS